MSDQPQVDEVSWSRVEEGFFVGSHRGNFIGYIDRLPSESYVAFDAFSRDIGTFPDRATAMAAVASPPVPDQKPPQW
ncbi:MULTISPECIES: hypothetical protein [Actinomycetes]|uniref:hypothetical protein n=1 Tax=Streptomyces sp. BPSDS2 TaxID=2571021 RepID=UPI001F0F76C3|nr:MULTISPECIES: hypothetical protein [Actinomycetes]